MGNQILEQAALAATEGVYVEHPLKARRAVGILALSLAGGAAMAARAGFAQSAPGQNASSTIAISTPAVAAAPQGGTIHGVIVAGTPGKAGSVPLPGVAVTARNTLTGKEYSTSTDIDGHFAMKIPRNGRYVVRVELAGFAGGTQEVVLNGVEAQAAAQGITITQKTTNFGMELASRAEAAEAKAAAAATHAATQSSGTQNLSLTAGEDTTNVTAGGGNTDAELPSLSGLGEGADAGNDSVTVNGQAGQMNGLANYSEDEIRQRIEDRVTQARANGQLGPGGDATDAIVGMLGGMMAGGGGGGGHDRGGRGGGRGSGGGGGSFRGFNPSQPHGSILYQGGNAALNSSTWKVTAPGQPHFEPNPSGYSNRFGVSFVGSPYIPGLIAPSTKQFMFLNLTGQKNLSPFFESARVPTVEERGGNFSQSYVNANGTEVPVALYDPNTGMALPAEQVPTITGCAAGETCIQEQAVNLLTYYPAPNIQTTDPTAYNYQTISNAGSNNVAINSRFTRTIGQTVGSPIEGFRHGGNSNAPPSLRQNINIGYNYSHAASDNRNIFLPLGGASESDGTALNAGYVIGYGKLNNHASVNWNRLNSETRNYFTDKPVNPATTVGVSVPNQSGGFADPLFYNGLPSLSISNFQSLTNATPSRTVNQTISYSDSVSWRRHKHNMRFGLDVRRVHLDIIGGNNPLGSFTFTGYATESPADRTSTTTGTSGDAFADFLLGLPTSTAIQAGLFKSYLRENTYDWYALDDWRAASNFTISYSLRYEYFGPYSEKNGHLANLAHDASFSTASIQYVTPGAKGYPNSLVNPDHTMYAPRIGVAWRPTFAFAKDLVVRGGYGINYNTGQYAVFAKSLSHQPPFAQTQTNTLSSGCTTTSPGVTANMTLAQGFGCSTGDAIQNNYAVNKNYRLGMVQLYNLNIQRTIPLDIVLNIGYNGAKGSNLDVVGSPNGTPTGVTTPGIAPFDYETYGAGSHSNQLVISAQKRQHKGVALGVTYVYSHTIDNASGVGGAVGLPVQNLFNLAAEEGNASFDRRQELTGNWVLELPFGPNRAYFNQGGVMSHVLNGFSLSGTVTIGSGTYYTPSYSGSVAEATSGDTYQQRPDRDFTQRLKGPGTLDEFFNKLAFVAPTNAGMEHYGSAAPGSIEGPGVLQVDASLSRTVQLGDTRSFEARVTANNVFNTVQYSGIDVTQNDTNFGQVTGAAAMRTLLVQARYRF